jgi:hypothetical protein
VFLARVFPTCAGMKGQVAERVEWRAWLVTLCKLISIGARMNAEQVVRATILKHYRSLSYKELAFHLDDSASFRAFARWSRGQHPSTSTLQDNIKALSVETWEQIQGIIIEYPAIKEIEKGRTIRVDSTATETGIHYPRDSEVLRDVMGAITRLLVEGKQLSPVPSFGYTDHRSVVKKRRLSSTTARRNPNARNAIGTFGRLPLRSRGMQCGPSPCCGFTAVRMPSRWCVLGCWLMSSNS